MPAPPARDLDWEGCFNVRDLGGLPAAGGRPTRWRSVVRADSLDHLTAAGWAAVRAYGVRTVVDLRNGDERVGEGAAERPGVTTVHTPLETTDPDFRAAWGGPLRATPLFYRPLLEQFPERVAAVVRAVGQAPPGGVVVHCGIGRDRAGLATLVLLTLAGVPPHEIVADHAISTQRLGPLFAREGREDEAAIVERLLAERGTTVERVLLDTLDGLDVPERLRAGGLTEAELAAARARLVS